MSKVYVLFLKKFPKTIDESYAYLPYYEIHYTPVQGKVAELNPDECVDVYKATLSEDETYVKMELLRVSNIDGKAIEELTESFLIERGAS